MADDLWRLFDGGELTRPELDPPTWPVVDTPPTGEIDDCLVTVDGSSASSEESPDSGWETYDPKNMLNLKLYWIPTFLANWPLRQDREVFLPVPDWAYDVSYVWMLGL